MPQDTPFVPRPVARDARARFVHDVDARTTVSFALFGDRVVAHVDYQAGCWCWTLWDTAFGLAIAARRTDRMSADSAMAQAAAAFDEYHRYLASGEPDLKLIETDLVRILADGWRLPGEDS